MAISGIEDFLQFTRLLLERIGFIRQCFLNKLKEFQTFSHPAE
jgi:hypothetical protein